MSKKEEKKNSKESVDDVKMTEKDADAAKTAGAEDDGTQAQKENTDAENPKEASQSSESQSADGIDTKKKDAKDALIEELQDKVKPRWRNLIISERELRRKSLPCLKWVLPI